MPLRRLTPLARTRQPAMTSVRPGLTRCARQVAYPYIARRLLTDEDPALRERLFQVGGWVAVGLAVGSVAVGLVEARLTAVGTKALR
jgi:hypothetical protein